MKTKLHRLARGTLLLAVFLSAFVSGCSQESKSHRAIEAAYENGEFEETVALCRYAIRRDVKSAKVYEYYGMALINLGRNFEGARQLEAAIELSPSRKGDIVAFLENKSREEFRRDRRDMGARILKMALSIDPTIDPGVWSFYIADTYFREQQYDDAARYYTMALEAYPDSSATEQAMFNLAVARDELDAHLEAAEILEKLLAEYPRGRLKSEARFKLEELRFEEAEKQYVLGNHEVVVEALTALIEETKNSGLTLKSRFLLGETYEALGDFESAYAEYREIVRGDRGASGRIVERAREKMDAFREAGLN